MNLTLRNVSKAYDGTKVLEDIDFCFPDKGLFLLCGENGSGKSTLMNIIAGKDAAYSGSLVCDGKIIDGSNRVRYSESNVCYLTQDSLVFDDMTVMENLLLPFTEKNKEKAHEILCSLSLEAAETQNASQLSGGEKQRLAFGRLLYQPRQIILLDEITAYLDGFSAECLIKEIDKLAENHLVIFATHDPRIMNNGKANMLRIENHRLTIEKEVTTEETICNHDSFIAKKSATKLGSAFHNEKRSHVILSLFVFLLSLVGVVFGSIGYSFKSDSSTGKDGYLGKVEEIFSETSPVLPGTKEDGFDGFGYHLLSDNVIRTTEDYSDYSSGMFFSGFFEYTQDGSAFYPLELTQGKAPENEGEAIISDACASKMKDVSIGDTIRRSTISFTVVGIYKSHDCSSLDVRYSHVWDEGMHNMTRICYAFMEESVFMKSSLYDTAEYFYSPTENNKEKFVSGSTFLMSDLDSSIVGVDKEGNDILAPYHYAASYELIGLACLIGLAVFLAVFVISFAIRNRRKYILLRFMGASRQGQTKDNLVSFAISSLSSLSIGLLLGLLVEIIMNLCYSDKLLGSNLFLFGWDYPLFFMFIAAEAAFLLFFALMLYFWLSKKDLTKDINEVKQK